MNKPHVYIASPYSSGNRKWNAVFQCVIWNQLMDDGLVWPHAPLWSHWQHEMFPRPYEDWLQYDLAQLPFMDVCLRLNAEMPTRHYFQAESKGADREVKAFEEMGKPVFYSIANLYEWVFGEAA